ncbi:MAG: RNA polymerase sigma factor [Streptosporangiaceae bacterium]
MRDRDIVAAIMTGAPAGLFAAYDGYAAGLYGYCRSLLGDPGDAADAVQDTFVIAAARLGRLRNPVRLRSWLYAVARNECHGRLRAGARTAGPDVAGEMTDDADSVIGFAQRDDLRHLLSTAIVGLDPGDREVIELILRHGLDGPALADVLGLPLRQAEVLAGRARGQLEQAAGAAIVARTGRRDCVELDAILDAWDGKPLVLWRKRIGSHIERCDICAQRQSEMLSPALLRSVLPLMPPPAGLRRHVLALVTDDSMALGYRSRVISRAGRFDQDGFPLQFAPVAGPGSPRRVRQPGSVRGEPGRPRRVRGGPARSRRVPSAGGSTSRIIFAAAAAVLVAGGGGVMSYTLTSGSGHASIAHRTTAPGGLSITESSAPGSGPLGSPSTRPLPAPDPRPASQPARPAPAGPGSARPSASRSASPSASPSFSYTRPVLPPSSPPPSSTPPAPSTSPPTSSATPTPTTSTSPSGPGG